MFEIEPAPSKEIVKLAQCCGRPGAQRRPGSAAEGDQQARPYHHKAMKESGNGQAEHEKAASGADAARQQETKGPRPSKTSNPPAKSGGVMSIAENRHG